MKARAEALFREYEAYHRDPVNVAIHKVAVPAILFHVVVMLDWVELGLAVGGVQLTAGMVVTGMSAVWYAATTPGLALVVVPFAVACLALGRVTPRWAVAVVAALAWVAQLIGHARFERRAPAFKDNVVQLLVGPAYVVALMTGGWPRGENARAPGGEQD